MSCASNGEADIIIISGNNFPPARWQFLESENPDVFFPLDGNNFYLKIRWPGGGMIDRNTVDNAAELEIDFAESILIWNYDIATSRQLPLGRIASYEIERRVGAAQQSLIMGAVIVGGGLNVD